MTQKPETQRQARFLTGPLMPHIVKMTLSASLGLISLFLVDLADLFFLSLLEDDKILAGLGFASTVVFFSISINIGFLIAVSALVAKAVGSGDYPAARRLNVHAMVITFLSNCIIASLVWIFCPQIAKALGAEGATLDHAVSYLRILIPSMPILALGMCASGALRAVGDAKQSMYAMTSASIVNAALDPVFIFYFDMGIEGAALASAISRFFVLAIAFYGLSVKHDLLQRFTLMRVRGDIGAIFQIALPAIATNLATPVGTAFVYNRMALFGESAVAGLSMVMRVEAVAFAIIYSLSGAIGPVIGQNFGARDFDRVSQSLHEGLKFTLIFVTLMGLVLFLTNDLIVSFFSASTQAAALVRLFCTWLSWSYIFYGCMFIAMAGFNNLGHPRMATYLNWGKAIFGVIPFVYLGAFWFGASGVLIAQYVSSVFFGILALYLVHRLVGKIKAGH